MATLSATSWDKLTIMIILSVQCLVFTVYEADVHSILVSYGTTELSKDSNVWTVLTNHIWVAKPDKLVYSSYMYTVLLHFIVLGSSV